MAQAERVPLPDIGNVNLAQPVNFRKELLLAALLQLIFKLKGLVKMVLDIPLVLAGDTNKLGDSACYCLFYTILDHRLVHNRQHLLG